MLKASNERYVSRLFEGGLMKPIKWEDIVGHEIFNEIIQKSNLTICKENLCFTKHVEFLGERIEKHSIIVVPSDKGYKFLKVQNIILEKNNHVLFLGEKMYCSFNLHYDSYEIESGHDSKPKILTLQEIYSNCYITYSCILNGERLCVNKWY